ncbi:MAG TPA: thiolase family protein [Planctomycetota bacterium]|nr:thiolase family protein [Planctomycetota bacterium]
MPSLARPTGTTVVITHALRTPIGKFMGGFSDLSAADLGTSVVRSLLERSGLAPGEVGELIFGNARQAGGGPNPARQIAVRAGLPVETTAWTVNMACGSGLKALSLAADSIRAGRCSVAIAGGAESMTRLPFLLPQMRTGYRLGHAPLVDAMYQDGFLCPMSKLLMGETAEKLAKQLSISRDAQDELALASQRKCEAARKENRFADEIAPVKVPSKKGETVVSVDEHPRDGATIEDLRKLKPVFDPANGTVTAGNSSGITDGAAALLVMSAEKARELSLEPLAYLGHSAEAGVEPSVMGIGPVPAVRKLEALNALPVASYDLIELNEAFAAQVLACDHELKLPMARVNVNGGAIALGHPIGATGARIVVTLLAQMRRERAAHGLATLCISGGLGIATAFHAQAR